MKKLFVLAAAVSALASGAANATIYDYTQSNGDHLVINTDTNSGTMIGTNINVSFTSADFANFTGGATPSFMATLSSLDGTRLVNGQQLTDNPLHSTTTHPQKLIFSGSNVNLWAWWGDPIVAGDYITNYGTLATSSTSTGSTSGGTPVPEPGPVSLFALALVGLLFERSRGKKAAAAAPRLAAA